MFVSSFCPGEVHHINPNNLEYTLNRYRVKGGLVPRPDKFTIAHCGQDAQCLITSAYIPCHHQVYSTPFTNANDGAWAAILLALWSQSGSFPVDKNAIISWTSGSFRCSVGNSSNSATQFGPTACNSLALISVVWIAATSVSSRMGSAGCSPRGHRDNASAFPFSLPARYTMLMFLTPLPNTLLHHLACLPLGFGVSSTAFTAEWSVKTTTSCPYRYAWKWLTTHTTAKDSSSVMA